MPVQDACATASFLRRRRSGDAERVPTSGTSVCQRDADVVEAVLISMLPGTPIGGGVASADVATMTDDAGSPMAERLRPDVVRRQQEESHQ